MLRETRRPVSRRSFAPIFAALGDDQRLALVTRLIDGEAKSISELADGSRVSRQAITKHLRVLERAGMVRGRRLGRETRYVYQPEPVDEMKIFLDRVSLRWDQRLARLKALVED